MRTTLVCLIAVAVLLVAGRIALPSVLRTEINRHLNRVPGYAGRVEQVHVALWRGAYGLRGVRVVKKEGSQTEPFFSARYIDFSLAWRQLIHGKILSDIIVEDARMNFVKTASAATSQLNVDRTWRGVVKAIFPIDVTHLSVHHGRIHFLDKTANPVVDIYVENLEFYATGLRNRTGGQAAEFPAHFQLTGDSIGHGHLSVWADADPLAPRAHFEIHGQLVQVALPALNPFLKAYGGVEMDHGQFNLYAEMAARDGRYQGYVKPFFVHVKFTDISRPGLSVPEKAWQALATGLQFLLKNKRQDELSTRIPFSGEFSHTDIGVWATIGNMLRNGFIHALPQKLEYGLKAEAIKPDAGLPSPPPAPAGG